MSANPARILAATVFMVALNLATVAHATPIDFAGNYTVAANNTDPGLTIETALENNGNLSFSLSQGDTTTIDLFDIWTTESTVNSGDDLAAKDIAVNFLFSLPTIFGETIAGETMGERVLLTRQSNRL